MRQISKLSALLSLLCSSLSIGCGADPVSTPDPTSPNFKYTEVQPEHPVPAVVDEKLRAALQVISTTSTTATSAPRVRLAKESLARIQDGLVRMDTLQDAIPEDLYHMCRDYMLDACMTSLADPSKFQADQATVDFLFKNLAGYMWGDRIYLTIDDTTDPAVLAATLIHESNHVLNRSECSYYTDLESQTVDDKKAFLEEYRAFATEYVFQNDTAAQDPKAIDMYASKVLVDLGYGFTTTITDITGTDPPESVVISLLADDGKYGWFFPEMVRFPAAFGACP